MQVFSSTRNAAYPDALQLQPTRYERAASLLVSLLILSCIGVGCMFVIWATQRLSFRPTELIVTRVEYSRGIEQGVDSLTMAALEADELPELVEPDLETALVAVTDAVSNVSAINQSLNSPTSAPDGPAASDRADEIDNDIIPRWKRWQVRWNPTNLTNYAQQLEFFGIELGAAGGAPDVDYAFKLSRKTPLRRTGRGKDEKRLYMSWNRGKISNFDRALLQRAGVATDKRILLQFYSEKLEDQMAWMEREHLLKQGRKEIKEIRKTVFETRRKGEAFEFYVAAQQYRPATAQATTGDAE